MGTTPNRNENEYLLPRSEHTLPRPSIDNNPAADAVRAKLKKLYATEPDAFEEEKQAEAANHRSKHQQFMHELNNSGKNLAEVQTAWHNYYVALPDSEKRAVWQEFYASNDNPAANSPLKSKIATPTETEKIAHVRNQMHAHTTKSKKARKDRREASGIQDEIREHATKKKLTKKQHLHSLFFGLGVGTVTIMVFLLSFFNEVIIAPFIQPARTSAETPLIVGSETVAPTKEPQVIIPKINVQIPIRFDITSNSEESMQKELESGIAHYPTTSNPGENGNGAYFGHSSNNIFNKGDYKFAFVLLNQLVPGDTFYISKDGKLYTYKVFDKKVVEPYQTEVLNPIDGHPATATLITCDPPGTSLRRLVVVGDQINPDPSSNTLATTKIIENASDTQLVGNGETLWGRVMSTAAGKAVLIVMVVGAVLILFRQTSKKPKGL